MRPSRESAMTPPRPSTFRLRCATPSSAAAWGSPPLRSMASTTVFATWQSAGLRAFDITDPFRPVETGHFVPPQPMKWMEPMRGRAKMRHTADVFAAEVLAFLCA